MKLYKLDEVAEELRMKWSWVDKQIRNGKIGVVRMGGTRLVSEKELNRIKAEQVSEDEMAAIRGYRGGTFVLRNASRGGIIGTLAMMDFYGLPDTYLTEYLARINGVSKEQVTEIANSQLPVAGMTIVVVGDRSVIDAQLAEVEELKPYLED